MKAYINGLSAISPYDPNGKPFVNDYLKCAEPDYKGFINPALARRMSRMVKMGVAAAKIGLKDAGVDIPDAIITGTGLGCIEDTEKFIASIIANEEKLLPPTSFIQSTHNTVGAQIALELKCHNYNYTYVHRGFSFEWALIDSLMLIAEKEASRVLLGSIDETTLNIYSITHRLGHWRQGNAMPGFGSLKPVAGEGAVFFMLGNQPEEKNYCSIYAPHIFYKASGTDVINCEIENFLTQYSLKISDIDLVILGANGNRITDSGYNVLLDGLFKNIPAAVFKNLCGEYHTASSFAVWLASNILKEQQLPSRMLINSKAPDSVRRILIYNHYRNINHSLLLLEK
ncbi:MAG: beta-ketoacyl synthase chain length factor [Lentimicrobiaceae bacterium]|nr:beta-ketoacyl synthase chain length factor [Lentimicrobiaceae bacterium]